MALTVLLLLSFRCCSLDTIKSLVMDIIVTAGVLLKSLFN